MDQTKSNFFENQILEAIETVAKSVTSKMQFDKTILCTITNDDNKKNGEYEVTDGSSTFKAYTSDDSYSKDTVVYVLIPQGDYNNQKTIVGKYVDTTGSAVKYTPSSESIIEIIKFNSIESPTEDKISDQEWSILANGGEAEDEYKSIVKVFETEWTNNTNIYTCASLKANFKTDLSQYNITSGEYGLILSILGYRIKEDGTPEKISTPVKYNFSSSEMYGDPYNYNLYFNHDIVFDLTNELKDIKITNIRLDFYQNGNFNDLTIGPIPSRQSKDGKEIKVRNNLFVKDIELAFGYSTENINQEGIKIYSTDELKYEKREDEKKILLKWFTKNNIGEKSAYGIIDELPEIPNEKKNNFSIYWYRYKIGNQESDPILGNEGFWEIIPEAVYNDKKYVHKQQQKVIMNYETKENEPVFETSEETGEQTAVYEESAELEYLLVEKEDGEYCYINDKLALANSKILTPGMKRYTLDGIKTSKVYGDEITPMTNPFQYNFNPNELLEYEKIKVVLKQHQYEAVETVDESNADIVYIHFIEAYEQYLSNELIFENKNPADKTLSGVNLIRNLKLECEDQSEGIYMIYNEDTGVISDPNKKDNILYAKFDNYLTKDILREQEHCKITWKIPKYSMVEPVDFKIPYKPITLSVEENGVTKEKKYYQLNELCSEDSERELIEWTLDGEYYVCSYDWTTNYAEPIDKKDLDQRLIVHYALKDNYIRNTNDVIVCEIEKYGKTYSTELKMNFGSAGVNGTKYSLIVYLEKEYGNKTEPQKNNPTSLTNVSYLDVSKKDTWVKVIAKLYDQNAKDITAGKAFVWEQYNHKEGLEIRTDSEKSNECYIRLVDNAKSNDSLSDFDMFKLEEYYGILEVCVNSTWAGNDTKLTSYYPVGVRLNDSIKQYVGANRLIYNTQGLAPEDNGFQAIHSLKIEKTDLVTSPSEVSSWKLKLINSTSNTDYNYAPSFDKVTVKEETVEVGEGEDKTSIVLYNKEIVNSSTLTPTNLYYTEMKLAKMTILALDSSNNVLFAQPLYYGQDVYNISLLNNWNGNQIIDAEGNKILTALIGAGIKENNNTFSGVFMGNICDVGSTENGKKTGLLGFNQGSHTFGFHTDGTAFIGPPGQGRIEFDGTQGIISSYDENTIFNLKEGSIYLSNSNNDAAAAQILIDSTGKEAYFQIKAKNININPTTGETTESDKIDKELIKIATNEYYLQSRQYTVGKVTYTEEETLDDGITKQIVTTIKDGAGVKFDLENGSLHGYDFELIAGGNVTTQIAGETTSSTVNKQIKISSKDADIPFSIGGDQFTVQWDGTMTAKNGYFTGKITAKQGTIGQWNIVENALYFGDAPKNAITEETTYLDTTYTLESFDMESGKAIIAPNAGINIKVDNTLFTTPKYNSADVNSSDGKWISVTTDSDGNVISTTTTTRPSNWWTDSDAKYNSDGTDIVLAIGDNFIVDKNGCIYANQAILTGYMQASELPEFSSELINIMTGKVAYETTEREKADDAEKADREKADADEKADREKSDNGLRGRIGGVHINTNGALSQIGTFEDNLVFIDSALGSSGDATHNFVIGYYDATFRKFYAPVTAYKEKVAFQEYTCYYDISNDQQYKCEDQDNDGSFELIPYDEKGLFDEDCPAKGYIVDNGETLEFYQKQEQVKPSITEDTTPLPSDTKTFYLDLETGQCYKYNDTTGYILTGPEDNVVLFMVNKKGTLRANNAVIGGTIYAHSGYIGGWTIQHVSSEGGITYGNTHPDNYGQSEDEAWTLWITSANITPNEGLWVKNGKLFGYTSEKNLPLIDGTKEIDYAEIIADTSRSEDSKKGYYGYWSNQSKAKQCVLNIGWNFAVDTDGILYASGADLVGYTHQSDFDGLTTTVNNIDDTIESWTNQYGIIAKYNEDESTAYFIAGLKEGATGVKVVKSKDGEVLIDEENNVVDKVNKTIYYVINDDKSYYYDGSNLIKTSDIQTFSVPRKGLFYASNGVISGTIYATSGWFSGGISAAKGKIGNWEITEDGNLIGYAYSNTTDPTLLSTTTLHAISGSDEDLNFSDIEVTDELQYSTTINGTSSITCWIVNQGSYKDEVTSETRYKYSIYSAPQTYQICQASFSNSYQSFQISGIKNTSSLKIVGFENIDTSNLSHDFWLNGNYYYRKLEGVFTSSTNKSSYTSITFSQDYSYIRNASMTISKDSDKDKVYKFLTGKSDVDTSDNFYTTCSVRIALLKVFDTERILEPLYGSAFSITGSIQEKFLINSINYSDINLSGNFSILRNGNIRIYPGAINVLNGENEKGIIYIDYDKLATTQIKNYLKDTYSLPPLLSVLTPSETIWSIITTESPDRSLFGILSHPEGENNYAGLVIDSTGNLYASGANPILGQSQYPWNNIYLNRFETPTFKNTITPESGGSVTLTRGGFHLNSSEPSNEFWPDALYTYNTYYQPKQDNYYSYVAFMRAVGDTSKKPSNVFLGCKSITSDTVSTTFQTSDDWTNDATYNFYIRFDGKAKFDTVDITTLKINGTTFDFSTSVSIPSIDTQSLTISSPSTSSLDDEILTVAADTTYAALTNQILSLYGGATTLSNSSFSLNNGVVTINSSGLLSCSQIKSSKVDFSSSSRSSLVLDGSGNLELTFKKVSSSDRIIAESPGLDTSKNTEKPCKGRDTALIKMNAADGTLLYYRPLFSLQGGTAGKTWDFGINPRHAALEDDSYQYSDELFLYGFSSSAYKNSGDPSFSLGIGRRWSTNSDSDDAVAGYNYIIPRTNIKLGTSGFKWQEIWSENELNTSSDIRLKTIQNSQYLDKLLIMYNNIIPIAYKRKNISKEDSHDRIHIGFSAQNVEEELLKVSLTSMDFGGICIDNTSDPFFEDGKMYGLRYGEFHGLHVLKNQEQDKRILELEQKVQYLENKILELSGKGV